MMISFQLIVLLQPLAINLINANKASDKIPIFLIRKRASTRGPGKLARRFRVIRIVNQIPLDSRIRRERFPLINQNRVMNVETGGGSKRTNKRLTGLESG